MNIVMDEAVTNGSTAVPRDGTRQQAQGDAEIIREAKEVINERTACISEKLEDTKEAAERLLKHGRYAVEDTLSEMAHKIKKHPLGFLSLAFAAGTVLGLLLLHSPQRQDRD